MNATSWGILVARMVAIVLAIDAMDGWVGVWGTWIELRRFGMGLPSLAAPIFNTVLALLLFVFARRFAPGDLNDDTEDDSPKFVASTIVAAFASYLFLVYTYSLTSAIFGSSSTYNPSTRLNIAFDAIVCVLCIGVVVRSRQVAEWVAQ